METQVETAAESSMGQTKKLQWERKLLDLGLRNPLINLRMTRTQLPILSNSLAELEDALSQGGDFTLRPRPESLYIDGNSLETISSLADVGVLEEEFRKKQIYSVLTETELNRTIKELYRSAKVSLEENGANTLYLALGMLRWFETQRADKPRYAPIILLPIEMVRKSAGQGYAIRLRDEEAQMNITLLEKLKQDFEIQVSGLDPLPTDEAGVDIRKVLGTLGAAVQTKEHWEVLEASSLGIFSFSQFVMWNDLRSRSEELSKNKIVRSLMEGRLCWDAEPMEMGQTVAEDDLLLPMPADASQLYAIREACMDRSFVLHGPPGTGKSQTITSLIANALAKGKSVLFVAEKMAALEVVQKRLDRIGIDPFCLELHSNKARKKNVLEQLRQATEVTRLRTPEAFAQKAQQISAMRKELDAYAQALHSTRHCGKTLFTLIEEYEQCRDAAYLPPFSRTEIRGLDSSRIENRKLLTERMVAAGRAVGHPHGHPLSPVGCTVYSQQLRGQAEAAVNAYGDCLRQLQPGVERLTDALHMECPANWTAMEQLVRTAEKMAGWYDLPGAWTQAQNPGLYFGEVLQMTEHFRRAETRKAQLLQLFRGDFLNLDGNGLFGEFMEISGKWALAKAMGLRKLLKKLSVYASAPLQKEALGQYLTDLRDYQADLGAGQQLLSRYGGDLGYFYNGDRTDWAALEQMAQRASASARELYGFWGSDEFLHSFCGNQALRDPVLQLLGGWNRLQETKNNVYSLLQIGENTGKNYLEDQLSLCGQILAHTDVLKDWIAFQAAAFQASASGLENVVRAYRGGMAHEDVVPACRRAMLIGLITDAMDEEPAAGSFSGAVFNEKIQQYKRADEEWEALSRQEIYCLLASRVPNFTKEAAHSSELGILQRFIKSGGRGVSVRRLFEQIPNLLPRLCPCMLMSPISAAQYLDPGREPFDLVVFDEASQLPTCKAVGVLARGKNAVVVGDPKQMPPTSFFAVNTVDEENLETEDLESILDDCLALNMPQSHLLWHYRSRHESLIAFSNRQFYENKLFTFPSVNDRASKVRLIHVDGVFDRGETRRNPEEARAVVEELKRRCHDPALSRMSVGVVTFNIPQQNLIDDLLNDACREDPELDRWVFQGEEPVFIKNLENVQGDERDVILFSIGYGPDREGKVSMNFGPLNRDGGWRRLNVAVSRARCEMMVFSTLEPEQIDLSRTHAEGVAALRSFLEYAAGRCSKDPQASEDDSCCTISSTICRYLREKGYDTDISVGRSAYRIDVAVADPEHPETYLLGILLDGEGYGKSRTTRDREIAQIGVLSGLGWEILRIWSVDWWDNRDRELKRILDRLDQLRQIRRTQTVESSPQRDVEPVEEKPAPLPEPEPEPVPEPETEVYTAGKLRSRDMEAEDFLNPGNEKDIQKRVRRVIEAEAPVSENVLIKRVVQSCGITRAGSRIQAYMGRILSQMGLPETVQGDTRFFWRIDQNPEAYWGIRMSGGEENRRDVTEVPVQEAANAVCLVLYEQIGMAREDLLRESARKLGYCRLVGAVPGAMEAGIQWGLDRGRITSGAGGTYVLTDAGMQQAAAIARAGGEDVN